MSKIKAQPTYIGPMLAHLSLLGTFFSFSAASSALVGRFLRMLVVFFRVWGHSGWEI